MPDRRTTAPPAPPLGRALRWLVGLHVTAVLALTVAATALGEDSCGGREWCFTRGALAQLALLSGGFVALLSTIGGSVTVLLLARHVRRTGTRVVVGVVGGVTTFVLAAAAT